MFDNSKLIGLLCGLCVVCFAVYLGTSAWDAASQTASEQAPKAATSRVVFETVTNGGKEEVATSAAKPDETTKDAGSVPEPNTSTGRIDPQTASAAVEGLDLSLPESHSFADETDPDSQQMLQLIASDAATERASLVRLQQLQVELEQSARTGRMLEQDIRERQSNIRRIQAEVDRSLDAHVETLLANGIESPSQVIPASATTSPQQPSALSGMNRESVVSMLRLMGQQGETDKATQLLSQMPDSRAAELLDLIAKPDQRLADQLADQLVIDRSRRK